MYGILNGGIVIAQFVAPMSVFSNRTEFLSDTLSLDRKAVATLAQRWEIETNLMPLSDDANDLFVDLVTKGHTERFTIRVPQNTGVIRRRTAVVTPIAIGAMGSSTVTVSSNVGLIPKGTFIRFDNHDKLYMTTTNMEGDGVMGIYPPLRSDINALFKHRDDVDMYCVYDSSVISGMAYTDGILMDVGAIKLIEKL